MTFDPHHYRTPGEQENDWDDAEYDALLLEQDRRANHGPQPLHDTRPVLCGRPVSPAIAEFIAEQALRDA